VRVLAQAAGRGSLEHKRCLLQVLAKLDDRRCAELLPPLLSKFSRDCQGPYWTCPEAGFAHVVMQVEDDAIWRQFLDVARRSSVGLRLEMMNPMCYSYIGQKNRDRRLALLAALLDDQAVRDLSVNPSKYEGPCAAFTFPKIEVRNFAALKIASILELDESPDKFWTSAQWKSLRETVQSRVKAMRLP
jgi:hypothetical protein